ncbi:MAG: hypothetical protein KJ718_03840 [Nanoarchaeota archaeon]|nr:hypothetical protein [Nanoarchaeota archaeon]MBU1051660.1 hypothetical protein [Nanoarchaeota archaeon]
MRKVRNSCFKSGLELFRRALMSVYPIFVSYQEQNRRSVVQDSNPQNGRISRRKKGKINGGHGGNLGETLEGIVLFPLEDPISTFLGSMAFIFLLGSIGLASHRAYSEYHQRVHAKKYAETVLMADTNRDGVVKHDEWAKVFRMVGGSYSVRDHPREVLTVDQMDRYREKRLRLKKDPF